jgi:hypothetical protein
LSAIESWSLRFCVVQKLGCADAGVFCRNKATDEVGDSGQATTRDQWHCFFLSLSRIREAQCLLR